MIRSLLALLILLAPSAFAADFRGAQFLGYTQFDGFRRDGDTLISPLIEPQVNWDELVLSWNLSGPGQATVEARIVHPEAATKYYQLGVWSKDARHSVTNQNDADGRVETDLLRATRPGGKIEVRVTLDRARPHDLKFLSLSLRDSRHRPPALEPNRRAWGKTVDVRPRSQLDYPDGARIWCSPTCSSMILDHWAQRLNRPELSLPVPAVAAAVHDPNWPGTGNWPFNTAFAGSFPGMRGYVTRLTDVAELEDWIEAGVPVATSVSYNRLKGRNTAGSGHLIVCVGFTESGDIIVNDPGTKLDNVRRAFPRDTFRQAWADSGNTVYLIYPVDLPIPAPRFGHWESRPGALAN